MLNIAITIHTLSNIIYYDLFWFEFCSIIEHFNSESHFSARKVENLCSIRII